MSAFTLPVSFLSTRSPHAPRGTSPVLRRACAADAAAFSRFLQGLSTTSRRLRFHGPCNPHSQALALRMCSVDGVRHQAWLAWSGQGDTAEVVGEARFVISNDDKGGAHDAELAIAVADAWQGRGVADALMSQVLSAARAAGVHRLHGDVVDDNTRMQAFMRRRGFGFDHGAADGVLSMSRTLQVSRPMSVTRGGLTAGLMSARVAWSMWLRRLAESSAGAVPQQVPCAQ
jgi:acetyltransferase